MRLRERDHGLEGSARRSCGSPVPVCTSAQSLQQTPIPRRPELAGDQSSVLPFHGLREGGSHPLSSPPLQLDWTRGCSCCWFPWRHRAMMLMERAASSHPLQGAPQTPSCWHCRHAACSPKVPNTEANSSPSPPGVQTPRGTGQARKNSSQSQPETYSSGKALIPNSSVKSPSLLDATRQGPEEKVAETQAEKSKYDPNIILLL